MSGPTFFGRFFGARFFGRPFFGPKATSPPTPALPHGPDVSRILRNEGSLYYAPTLLGSLPLTAPFGGKLLGLVRDVELRWLARGRRRRAGGRVYEQAITGQEAELAFTVLQWDPDVIPLGFPRVVSTSSPSGLPGMLRVEGAGQPRVLQPLEPILFVPTDPRNLAVLFLRPVPEIVKTARLRLMLSDDAVTPFVFTATLNSSWNSLYVDKLEHLKLT